MIAMAEHATYVIADQTVGCWPERMPKRPSDAAGERRPKAELWLDPDVEGSR
jgi:hypothetical protein